MVFPCLQEVKLNLTVYDIKFQEKKIWIGNRILDPFQFKYKIFSLNINNAS